jgi:Fe-Mn family superoxide dismutase
MPFELPKLNYAYDAFEPHIDAKTMEIHHSKHHQTYITNLNAAIKDLDIANKSVEDICKNISAYSSTIKNNAGGHFNHTFFWKILKPNSDGEPVGELAEAIKKTFGSFSEFKTLFTNAATSRFGSGWAWLYFSEGKLAICSTPNQDNPLMDVTACKGYPLLALDVWEHAYYLNYQNKRADYINAFWNIVNWEAVAENFQKVKQKSTELTR